MRIILPRGGDLCSITAEYQIHDGHCWMFNEYLLNEEWMNERMNDSATPSRCGVFLACQGCESTLENSARVHSEHLRFALVLLADRWRSANGWPAPDANFGKHRKQVPAQEAACLQHPLPVSRSGPPTNVWCKYPLFSSAVCTVGYPGALPSM